MAKFLTQDWFTQVEQLTQNAGELNLPPTIKNLNINLKVTDNNGQNILVSFANGMIQQGLQDNAQTTVSLDTDTLKAILLDRDLNKAMNAFMQGKIRVEGDMGHLMSVQTATPSPEQKALFKQIVAITEI